jgi:hypothetical protein
MTQKMCYFRPNLVSTLAKLTMNNFPHVFSAVKIDNSILILQSVKGVSKYKTYMR